MAYMRSAEVAMVLLSSRLHPQVCHGPQSNRPIAEVDRTDRFIVPASPAVVGGSITAAHSNFATWKQANQQFRVSLPTDDYRMPLK
jgi:hypothetical protein